MNTSINRIRFGKRLMKTAVAVFATAQICYLLNIPMIFAVIAAIVSIEPTVSGSIRKGMIRLPAAGIGAAFAMLFDYVFGPQPITYVLSAAATIYVCQLLRWNDSILVATLTAVNMIPLIEAHFLLNFVVRLGSTTIGIGVATLVNYLLFRPDYAAELRSILVSVCSRILAEAGDKLDGRQGFEHQASCELLLNRAQSLLAFQNSDYRYKKTSPTAIREIVHSKRALKLCRSVLFYMEACNTCKTAEERTHTLHLLSLAAGRLAGSPFVKPVEAGHPLLLRLTSASDRTASMK